MSKDRPFHLGNDGVIRTPPALIRWPHLTQPRARKNSTKPPQYEVSVVLDGSETQWIAGFRQALDAFALQKFGQNIATLKQQMGDDSFMLSVKPNSLPKRAKHAGIKERPNGINFACTTQYALMPHAMVDRLGVTLKNGRESAIYDGCFAIVAFNFYEWRRPTDGKMGINTGLIGIQHVGDGPQLGSGDPGFTAEEHEYNAPGYDPAANFAPGGPQQPTAAGAQAGPASTPAQGYPQPGQAPAAAPAAAPAPNGGQFGF